MELSSPKTRNFVVLQEGTCKTWKSKVSYFLLVEKELFKYKRKRKKSYTFPYKEAKFSKLKDLLIIIIKPFLSFYNTFSILNKLLFSIFWKIFVTFKTILLLFFLFAFFHFFFFAFYWYLSQAFFAVILYFFDNI